MKKELKNRGLSTTGNKNELQERLQLASLESAAVLDPNISELLDEEDVLNVSKQHCLSQNILKNRRFQDDELDEEDKSLLADESSHIEDESLLSTSSHSTKADLVTQPAVESESPKKILLKRSIAPPAAETEATTTEEPSPKVVKLTELTAAERLELRMKKFGASGGSVPVNSDLRKQARAERFGVKAAAATTETTTTPAKSNSENKPANNKLDTSNLEAVSVEVLKKRAERFGAVSSKLISVENAERLAKRQDRFGVAAPKVAAEITTTKAVETTPASNGSTTTAVKSDFAEKAKMRLERFKTAEVK